MDNSAIRIFVLKLIIAILLLITYLYIEKLENSEFDFENLFNEIKLFLN